MTKETKVLDKNYARQKMEILLRDLDCYNSSEFWREMSRIASGATGSDHAEQLQARNAELEQQNRELLAHVERIKDEREAVELADNQTVFNRSVSRLCGTIDESPTTSLAEHDQELISRERKRWAREDVEALKERDRKAFLAGADWEVENQEGGEVLFAAMDYADKNARGEV